MTLPPISETGTLTLDAAALAAWAAVIAAMRGL